MSTGNARSWGHPAGGPWWRFVPRSRTAGYLGIVAGVLVAVQAAVVLVGGADGGNSTATTVLEVVLVVLGVASVVRGVDGLRVLRGRHRRHGWRPGR
ncbi:hypothetical protein [Streptomyces sp. NBC_01190]|uniref:hypothetical protein n=1 Tax=Streptomyces sp. NBC_01190 TaxID=2903767 RepID=UPI00386C2386|nr:hypothetical protein OG519_19450 [Streptomyces sp. NBC_01190]